MKPLFGFNSMDGIPLYENWKYFDRVQDEEASWTIKNRISQRLKE